MSIRVMSWVWENSRAEGTDRLVLLALADYAGDDGYAYPSVARLALKARISTRTVQRCIRSLMALGEVTVSPNQGRGGANVYRVQMRQFDTPANLTPVPDSHPDNSSPVTPVTRRGDTRVTRTVINHQTPQPPASGGPVNPETAHCERHSKRRKGCTRCDQAARRSIDLKRADELRRSDAVFAESRAAAAAAVPRPKEASQ